jgi:beta-glucosidase
MTDGPLGVRRYDEPVASAFPAGIALAATFSEELARRYGRAVARETKTLGRNVLLGPCVNIARVPHGGRNFESYGEDPLLAGRLASAYVRGVQGEGVAATVKHFAVNNQETDRMTINAVVDERTLREIYLPAFESAVTAGGARAVMCSYNKLNGPWACENPHLLREILRDAWGFTGLVMSDWGATHSTAAALNAGLDLEMGQASFLLPDRVKAAMADGSVKQGVVDDAVRHQLQVIAELQAAAGSTDAGSIAEPNELREFARAGIVLLKNERGILPLSLATTRRIAVVGPFADNYAAGGGSSRVPPRAATTPLAGIRALLGGRATVSYAAGGSDAITAATGADAVVVFLGETDETEGVDRSSLELAQDQIILLRSILAVNPNTVVVLTNGAPLVMRTWVDEVPTLLETWYGGQESGNAIADVLFGVVSPSGHLPVTFPKRWEDCPAYGRFPGFDGTVRYDEGILVGYRYFDTLAIEPEFPFGHGLSYVAFEYAGLSIDAPTAEGRVSAHLTVKNPGALEADEVVQVYVSASDSTVQRPAQILGAFQRARVRAGESANITVEVPPRAFSHFDVESMSWTLDHATFELRVGRSSRDIRLRTNVTIR